MLNQSDYKNALDVLRSLPRDSLVAEFYDDSQEFSDALGKIFGDAFEYPDFSGRKIAQVVKMAAKEIAALGMGTGVGDPLVPADEDPAYWAQINGLKTMTTAINAGYAEEMKMVKAMDALMPLTEIPKGELLSHGWSLADEYTKDISPGAMFMRTTGGKDTAFASYDFTIVQSALDKWIPMHGSVAMAPVASPEEAAYTLAEYWHELPKPHKTKHVGSQIPEIVKAQEPANVQGEDFLKRNVTRRQITVHDFEGTPPGEVYDRTQTDDSIKDGDVLNLGNGNVAILMKAWPTVVLGEIEHFHRLASGATFESIDDGKYAASAVKARELTKSRFDTENAANDYKRAHQLDNRSAEPIGGGKWGLVFPIKSHVTVIDGAPAGMRQHHGGLSNFSCEPQELTSAEFAKSATAVKLENHGRGWEVFHGGASMGFADGESKDAAIKQAHSRAVNNAIYSHSSSAPETGKREAFPPMHVISEYPELEKRYTDVFAERAAAVVLSSAQDGLTGGPVNWAGGERWTFDRGAMLGEPFAFLDGDAQNSVAAMFEVQTPGKPTSYEVRKLDGVLASKAELPSEAARIAEADISVEKAKAAVLAPSFKVGERFEFKPGDAIVANGFRGTVNKALDGTLAGMVEVSLPGGVSCNSSSFPDCYPAFNNGVEVLTDGRFIGAVKEVSKQFVVQNAGRGRMVAHESHRFAELPKTGDVIDLQHRAGKVTFGVEKDKGRGNER